MGVTSYLVASGSNRRARRHGVPAAVLRAATARLAALGRVVAAAPPRRSAAMGPAGRAFENGAALVESSLAPPAMLAALKAIEREFGRRRGRRWGARVLDLDIVLWSGGRVASRRLTIPHPGLPTRAFVLGPAVAIAPGWRDPVTGRTVRQLHARLTAPRPKTRRSGVGS